MRDAANLSDSRGFKRQKPLVLEVRDELERMILEGEVPAGERLNEHSLAMQMGVSRAPVRDAARSLAADGLVTAVANEGVYVRKLSLEDALELYDLRAMLAGMLCARVAERAEESVRVHLRRQVVAMAQAIEDRDEEAYFTINNSFHSDVADAARMQRPAALYKSLGKEVRLFRFQVLTGTAALRISNEEHDRIVAAIEAGDAQAASQAGSQHHLNGKSRLLALSESAISEET